MRFEFSVSVSLAKGGAFCNIQQRPLDICPYPAVCYTTKAIGCGLFVAIDMKFKQAHESHALVQAEIRPSCAGHTLASCKEHSRSAILQSMV